VPPRPLPYCEVKRKLESAGFTEVSQRGSHVKFIKQTDRGIRIVIVSLCRRFMSKLFELFDPINTFFGFPAELGRLA
jgi:hypothetical protein